jgi:hypothetical protein|tara:strand:- start:1424 stop:1780 length:357 start_codon:yes stop_codon:yes gene_type:complete
MRVRLSYTVDEEDVLAETAKIINLSATDIQQAIVLFNEVQGVLKGDGEEVVHIPKALDMIEEIRTAFVNVDTRLAEVTEIIRGFDDYHRQIKRTPAAGQSLPDTSSGIKVTPEDGDSE